MGRHRKPKISPDALEAYEQFLTDAEGLATPHDRAGLILLAEAWAEMRSAEKNISEKGTIVLAPNKYPMPNPFCKIRDSARATIIKLLQEFGLTPNSRARIEKASTKPEPEQEENYDY